MAVSILVPRLGAAMTVGTFLEWLVDDGAEVQEGQELYVIGTDKVDSTVTATATGTLHIDPAIEANAEYPIGHRLGEIG